MEAETAAARHTADLQAARDQVKGAVLSVHVSAEGPRGVCMFPNACASMFVSAGWPRMSSRAVERAHPSSCRLYAVLGLLCPPPPAHTSQVTAAQDAQAASVSACAVAEQEVATLKSQLAAAQESLQSLETASKMAQADLEQRLAAALAAASSPVGVDVATSMDAEGEEGEEGDAKAAAAAAERCAEWFAVSLLPRPHPHPTPTAAPYVRHSVAPAYPVSCLFHASRAGRQPPWRRQCPHGTRCNVV